MSQHENFDVAAHLQALEQELLQPAVRAKPEAVSALLSDGFREFGSSGRVYTHQEILETLVYEAPRNLSLSDFICELLHPEIALVTYRSHAHHADGAVTSALRSSLWIRREGRWRLHFHQGTKE